MHAEFHVLFVRALQHFILHQKFMCEKGTRANDKLDRWLTVIISKLISEIELGEYYNLSAYLHYVY